MDIRGIPAGMGLFYMFVSVQTENDGWSGSRQYPTVYTVGGTQTDAIHNMLRTLDIRVGHRFPDGSTVTSFSIDATPADPESDAVTVSWHSEDNARPYGGMSNPATWEDDTRASWDQFTVHAGTDPCWDGIVIRSAEGWRYWLRYADGERRTPPVAATDALSAFRGVTDGLSAFRGVVRDLIRLSAPADSRS